MNDFALCNNLLISIYNYCSLLFVSHLQKGLIPTAYGQEVEPLGSTRLQVVTLVAALVVANDPIVHNALYELNTVEHLLVRNDFVLNWNWIGCSIYCNVLLEKACFYNKVPHMSVMKLHILSSYQFHLLFSDCLCLPTKDHCHIYLIIIHSKFCKSFAISLIKSSVLIIVPPFSSG